MTLPGHPGPGISGYMTERSEWRAESVPPSRRKKAAAKNAELRDPVIDLVEVRRLFANVVAIWVADSKAVDNSLSVDDPIG